MSTIALLRGEGRKGVGAVEVRGPSLIVVSRMILDIVGAGGRRGVIGGAASAVPAILGGGR